MEIFRAHAYKGPFVKLLIFGPYLEGTVPIITILLDVDNVV